MVDAACFILIGIWIGIFAVQALEIPWGSTSQPLWVELIAGFVCFLVGPIFVLHELCEAIWRAIRAR